MKCYIIERVYHLWKLHSNEYDSIGEARVKLDEIANDLAAGEWWSYDNDELVYDVYAYKIVKSSSVSYDHSYNGRDYFTIK